MIVLISLLFVFKIPVISSNYAGVNTAEFLRLVPDARTAAMGRASIGLADCEAAVFYNPAGLLFQNETSISFTHHYLFNNVSKEFLVSRISNEYLPFFRGVSLLYINYGSITHTTYDMPDGMGSYSANEGYLNFSFAQKIFSDLSVGANVKFYSRKIESYKDRNIAVDLSCYYLISETGFSFGAGYYNVGPKTQINEKKESIPTAFAFGIGYYKQELLPLKFSFDVIKILEEDLNYGFGAEYIIYDAVSLRAGYNTQNDIGLGLSFGIGMVFNNVNIDYTFEPNDDVQNSHYFSVSYLFGHQPDPKSKVNDKKIIDETIEKDESPLFEDIMEVMY